MCGVLYQLIGFDVNELQYELPLEEKYFFWLELPLQAQAPAVGTLLFFFFLNTHEIEKKHNFQPCKIKMDHKNICSWSLKFREQIRL